MKLTKHLHNLVKFISGSHIPVCGPLKVAWEVTEKCNSQCLACDRWRIKDDRETLTQHEGLDLIDQLAQNNVVNLSFTGGEPLLRPDIFKLISHAKDLKLTTSLSCSGHSIHSNNAEKICKSGLDLIYISLDGASPETHDYLRGIKGSFNRTMEAISLIQKKLIMSKPKIFVNITVNRYNFSELVKITEICVKKKISGITIQPIQKFSEAKFNPQQDLLLTPAETQLMSSNLKLLVKNNGEMLPIMNEYYNKFETYVNNPSELYNYRCVAAFFSAVVDSKGLVFPCPVKFKSLGSLREKSFEKIWHSKKSNDLRKKIKDSRHPICWFNCVAPMTIFLSYFHPTRLFKLLNPTLLSHTRYKMIGG